MIRVEINRDTIKAKKKKKKKDQQDKELVFFFFTKTQHTPGFNEKIIVYLHRMPHNHYKTEAG